MRIQNGNAVLWNNLAVSYMLNLHLPYDPVISLLGTYPRKIKMYINIEAWTSVFIVALFLTTQKWK